MSASTQPDTAAKQKPLAVAVVTADPAFFSAAIDVVRDVGGASVAIVSDLAAPQNANESHPLYAEAVARARHHLEKTGQRLAITLVQASSLDRAAEQLAASPNAGPLGMVWLDAGSPDAADAGVHEAIEAFYAKLAASSVATVRSPYSVLVHVRTPPWRDVAHVLADRYLVRVVVPERPWMLRVEQLAALFDFVERTLDKPRNHKSATRELTTTLGDEVTRFLGDRAGSEWLLFYYTGSSVSPLIDHFERAAVEQGVLVLRGANEHALISGALANHLLHDRPFVIVIGTAMMDEFRGTLANVRASGARGFILCPESDASSWFTFQGTITGDEDMREALAARRVQHVYFDKPETMTERFEEAFRLYEQGRGPVVLLLTQAVIDARDPLPRRPAYPQPKPRVELGASQDDAVAKALAILNHDRTRVLWQASRVDAEEEELVYSIAERAGVALVDTLGHPGPSHRRGKPVPNYLGTLGLYGFNQRSYAFLHDAGKLAPRAEQCIFFVKSKVGQRATNFTPFRRTGLRMVQITDRADHVAPDVELALVADAKEILRRIAAGLAVDADVLAHRRAAIQAATAPSVDILSRVPSLPMTPNYFFRELGALFERLVTEDGFDYTGVYDVGRCSVSAMRSVPRTRRGYSGWYGRALMGDAPAAVPTLAITEPSNIVAFVGDGARSIIADPVPHLLENALAYPERLDKSVTVFYFSNGTYSGIRTYRERLASRWGGRQMRCVDLLETDSERAFGPLTIVRRGITSFDAEALREALLARRRLNVFTVFLGHNNDDDGFSFVTADWQREAG